jgi:hypothetical protein
VNGDAPAVPRFAKRLLALLQADVARGRSIRDLVRVRDLLAASGARTYGTSEAPVATYGSELMWNGERVRQIGTGVVKRGAKRGEEFVMVEIDRATLVFAHRPGAPDVRLVVAERPAVARALRLLDQHSRRPPKAPRPREQWTQPRARRVRVHSGSRGDPPGDGEDDDDPHDARRALRPAGALPDQVAARRRQ